MLPPEARLPEARGLIDQSGYFIVHAPRQTGKTTTLISLAKSLTTEGRFAAVYFSCELAEVAGDDFKEAQLGILAELKAAAARQLPKELWPPAWPRAPSSALLGESLRAWASSCPKPIVLFFDEIDAVRGESLRTVLRQLRAGYTYRPNAFPSSVVLCGLRDVRDYKAASGGDPERLGTSSPFNIKVKSLRLGDFELSDVRALYAQHTFETGQDFEDLAVLRAFVLTRGQPWLVNALAREIIEEKKIRGTITAEHVDEAKEGLILARATHLDSLVSKLHEPQVRSVIQTLLGGGMLDADPSYDDDVSYVRDLGLVTTHPTEIANPIYREVIVRVLTPAVEDSITLEPRSFVRPDGGLDFGKLLREFVEFWKEHGDILSQRSNYHEVAPQLVIMAFFQRLVNGGGYIEREYGVGRGRIDLLIRWPIRKPDGVKTEQREAIELKVWRRDNPLERGLAQLDQYLERLGLDRGVLVIFDRRPNAPKIGERTKFEATVSPGGRAVTVLWA
ncbi:MAG: ATP-binding protein [Deltaproteobacteria bacterium]|nr:ATP-binding protein [Deltaproteobacteria bacterium]